MRFRNYINRHNKKNRIYAEEELLAMTLNDLFENEDTIMSQDADIGIPTYEELKASPNTRWFDKFINDQGEQDGGYYGSILPNYPSIFHQEKPILFQENPNKSQPIYMNNSGKSMQEENPTALTGENEYKKPEEVAPVLEGGVSKTVIPQIENLKDKIQTGIENVKTKYDETKSKYEGLNWDVAAQKAASKLPIINPVEKDYYQLSAKLKDGEEIPERIKKENDIYKLSELQDKDERERYYKELADMYKLDPNSAETYEKLKNKVVVMPNEDSRLYKYAKNSEAMEKWIVENYDKIKNGEKIDKDSLVFPIKWYEIFNEEKSGLFGTIHKSDIENYKIEKDGSLTGKIKDKYNFEKWDNKEGDNLFKKFITYINNNANKQQEAHKIEQFPISMPIHYTKEEIEEILKRKTKR